jgi:hypothetical protein
MRENAERWKQLCEQASKEQDPKKLIELTRQINHLLLFKLRRIYSKQSVQGFFTKGGGA